MKKQIEKKTESMKLEIGKIYTKKSHPSYAHGCEVSTDVELVEIVRHEGRGEYLLRVKPIGQTYCDHAYKSQLHPCNTN